MPSPTITITGIEDILNSLDNKNVRKGVRSGLNKLGTRIKKAVQDAAANEYNLQKSKIKAASRRTQRAAASRLSWSLFVSSARNPLINFGAKQNGVSFTKNQIRRTRKDRQIGPVSVQVRRRGARKDITGTPGVFIARMPTGHIGIFRRKRGRGRLPVNELFTISVSEMISSAKVQQKQNKVFNRTSEKFILGAVIKELEK
jgi:hypothetical protein